MARVSTMCGHVVKLLREQQFSSKMRFQQQGAPL
jgi:hypothetical protein